MDRERAEQIIRDVNSIKSKLISMTYELRDCGADRKANSFNTIIGKLEAWQHTRL